MRGETILAPKLLINGKDRHVMLTINIFVEVIVMNEKLSNPVEFNLVLLVCF
jgi:hypothetical protein